MTLESLHVAPTDNSTPEERADYEAWRKEDEKLRMYILASLNEVLQSQHQSMSTSSAMLVTPPNPGLTRLADPNRFLGRETRTGTLYLIFFLKANWHLWVWPTSYNRIKRTTPGVVSIKIYTHILSPILQIQNCTFTFTNQSTEPTCSEPLQVCWPSCMRMFADVFSCTYTD